MKGKAKQTQDNHFNIEGTVQQHVITPFVQQIAENNFQIGASTTAEKSVFDKRATERTMQQQISESSKQKGEEEKVQKICRIHGEQSTHKKKVPEKLAKKDNPVPQILVLSTQQDEKKIVQEFRMTKQPLVEGGTDAKGTMEPSQMTTHPTSQEQKRKTQEVLKKGDTKQPTANRCPMLKSRISTQFNPSDQGIDGTRKISEVPKSKRHTNGKKIANQTSQIHGVQSKPHGENQSNYKKGTVKRKSRLPPIDQHGSREGTSCLLQCEVPKSKRHTNGKKIGRQNSQIHGLQSKPQGENQSNYKQGTMRRMNKLPPIDQHGSRESTSCLLQCEVPKSKRHTNGKKIGRQNSQIHGLQSKPQGENQSNYKQGTMRRMNKLPPIEQHGSREGTSPLLQISLAKEKVLIRRMTKLSTPRSHIDGVERNGGTVIQQKSARRPGVMQHVTRSRPSPVEEQQAKTKEDALHVSRYPRSREMVPLRKLARKYTEINQAKSKRAAKVSIRPVNESCKVVIFNGRRVAIQQESNDYDYPGRRNGLCAGTDPAQQELTFIRVLRKRF